MRLSRIVTAGSAVLAACGALGMAPAAAQSSPASVPTWARQQPAAHPSPRWVASMAYDAADGTVVLFGGMNNQGFLFSTLTWDGTTWTRQHPAVHPTDRFGAAMAYDAATRTVVLFGGQNGGHPHMKGDTWTWNGTTWTEQSPATSPPARADASMAYDAATRTVVLFGGSNLLGDTWTWNGTTWTEQSPATSPPARADASMAYDAATRTVVLFGGSNGSQLFGDTWTWNGTTWTKQSPAASPPARDFASMAYDAAAGNIVLFGGEDVFNSGIVIADTWTWNGTTWARQHPAVHPSAREGASMAYDAAAGNIVLFGGFGPTRSSISRVFGDTWIWG